MSYNVVVFGASQGIGLALCEKLLGSKNDIQLVATHRPESSTRYLHQLQTDFPEQLHLISMEARSEKSIQTSTQEICERWDKVDLCIVCIGVLNGESTSPERSIDEISERSFIESFQVNSISSLLIAKGLKALILKSERPLFASVSAKVGSITDNKMGGWYSYRMSKTALNMGIKNLSIEFSRKNKSFIGLALHPGTTETRLSEPFIQTARKRYQVHTPEQTASHLMAVIDAAREKDLNGGFLSWDGEELPW